MEQSLSATFLSLALGPVESHSSLVRPIPGPWQEKGPQNSESSAESAVTASSSWEAPHPLQTKKDGFARSLKSSMSQDALAPPQSCPDRRLGSSLSDAT